MEIFWSWACEVTWAHIGTPGDHLHYFPHIYSSSEAIFKIPDATRKKIHALIIFGALIDEAFAPMTPKSPYSPNSKKSPNTFDFGLII